MDRRQRGTASVVAYWPRWSGRAFRAFATVGLLGALAASSAHATTTIPGGNLNGTLTQAGSPYVVTGHVTVTTSLTVEAGVVVRFRNALLMQVTGTLATQGTAGQPVTFTSDPDTVGGQPAAGNWYGIRTSSGAALALANTFIRYGGYSNTANLYSSSGTISSLTWNGGGSSYSAYDGIQVTSSATTLTGLTVQNNMRNGITLIPPANAAVTLTGLTVQTNAGNGINLTPAGPLSVSVLDQLVVSNNVGRAIAITQNVTSIPWGTLSGSGNGTNGIYVAGIMWGSNRRWEWGAASPNFPYVLDNLQVSYGDTLVIAAGAVVKFPASGRLYLNVSGSGSALQTLGTTNNPVWFTSIKDDTQGGDTNGDGGASVPAPGNYYGVTCYGASVLSLAQTWMAYGGAGNSANLASTSGAISSLTWNGGGSSYSAFDGIQVTSSATTLTGLTVQNNVRNGITLIPPANAAITLTGLTVQTNAGNGINLTPAGPLSVSVLDQLVVSNNVGWAIAITQNATSIPWGTLSGSGNGTNGIYVAGIMWGSNRRWEWGGASPNFPYVLDNLQVSYGDTLVIAAGAVVKFPPSGRLYLNVSGSGSALQTLGTTNNPVWFTSIKDDTQGGDTNGDGGASVPAPGNYYGITCYGASVLSLAQTWMAYGGASNSANLYSTSGAISSLAWNGGGCSYSAYDGIQVTSSATTLTGLTVQNNVRNGITLMPPANAAVTLTGLTVQTNAGNGINLAPSGPLSVSVLDQLVVSNNVGRAIVITQNVTSIPWGILSGSGNGTNGIYVTGIMWGSNRKWEWSGASPNFPYVLDNLHVSYGDTLAIAAGAVVKFPASSRLYLNVSGSALQTLGTTNNPVWFTSIKDDTQGGDTNGDGGASVPAPGNYYGITCYGNSVLSLAQTWMAYGGASNSANLYSYTGTISSLTWNGGGCIRSAYRGIWVNTASLSVNGVRFASNLNDGAYITPGSNGSATGCDFYGNGGTYGLYNSSATYTIDARNSWWGDPSGPNDPSQGPPDYNPSGLGSRVSDYVTYRPWATTMQTNEPPTGFALLTPAPGEREFRDTLHFRWSHSTAPDGGPISYDLQVDDDPAFGSPEINQTGLPDTTFNASDLLESEYVYYWKVLANDTRGGQRVSTPSVSWFQTYPGTSGLPGTDLQTHSVVFRVGDPAPNPFHGPNSLAFSLPASARVRLDVFDIAGRLVRTLIDGPIGPGEHIVAWDGQDRAGRLVESGVYLYRFRSDRGNAVRRAVLLR